VILPAKFVEHIGIQKGDYVRIYKEHNRILVERLSNQEPQIKVKACRVIYPPEIKENT
jgi:antitoxin component of MazEF toxin-antitoxin module